MCIISSKFVEQFFNKVTMKGQYFVSLMHPPQFFVVVVVKLNVCMLVNFLLKLHSKNSTSDINEPGLSEIEFF